MNAPTYTLPASVIATLRNLEASMLAERLGLGERPTGSAWASN